MATKTTAPADPDLAMTDDEVATILTTAQADAEQAARSVEAAEAVVRGETPPAGTRLAAIEEITPARLAELRAAAEFATLKVGAAERRVEEIRHKRKLAEWERIRAQIRAEAADDLNSAEHLVDKLDTLEEALRGLCEALHDHNDRIERWARMMGTAGIRATDGEKAGPEGFTFNNSAGSVTIGEKVYRPLTAGKVVGAVVHRVMQTYPRPFIEYGAFPIAERDWTEFPGGPVDPRARIRRDA